MACYIVTPQDREVAKCVEGWSGADVARLRGMYETQRKKTLDLSDPVKASKILIALRKKLVSQHVTRSSNNMVEAFKELRQSMPAGVRENRVRMLTTMFSSALDKIQTATKDAGTPLTRIQIANGVKDSNGILHYGQDEIFNMMYDRLLGMYATYKKEGDTYKMQEIAKMLDNFGPLCAYVKAALRDTEGMKLGSSTNYAAETVPGDFGDNDLSAWFDPSENTKESWQQASDMTSSFSSLGEAVRRILSTFVATDENNRMMRDDLDCPVYINPIRAHQSLAVELRGVQTESDMVSRIEESALPFKTQLLKVLKENDQVRTQFLCDLRKNMQLYGDVSYDYTPTGVIKTKTRILNKIRNILTGGYNFRISRGKTLSENSVYNSDGSVNWANVQALRVFIRENFVPKDLGSESSIFAAADSRKWKDTPFGKANITAKANMLMHVTRALGIDLDSQTANKIAADKNLFSNAKGGIVRGIRELVVGNDGKRAGIDAILSQRDIEALERGDYNKLSHAQRKFKELLKYQSESQKNISKQGNIQEKVNRLLDAIATKREAFRIESRVVLRDKKGRSKVMYSDVAPSYMGDYIERINTYATAKNKEALRQFVESKYLDSSMFRAQDGRILNRWLRDLYEEDFTGSSLAETMQYHRFLGEQGMEFEEFTSKQHAQSMMHEFFFADNLTWNDYQKNGRGEYVDKSGQPIPNGEQNPDFKKLAVPLKYANYPVFILGDSGVCKFIRAKRYNSIDILNGMYDIYLSELQRNKLVKAANADLKAKGYKVLDNIKEDGFKMLPFLNDKKYAPKGESASWTETQVKQAIKLYMRDAFAAFKENIARLGLLEKVEVKDGDKTRQAYKYFDDVIGEFIYKGISYEESLDRMLATYFWNTKFATLQQFQLMTIDVAFYKNTKDLQKRYKEIHAPGRPASIQAKDFDGNYYCGVDKNGNLNPIETCAYFDDPKVNAELSNPEFMSALLYQYAAPGKRDEVLQAIKEDIITPKQDEAEEKARIAKLKELLGDNFSTYESYQENALADGQGYRTLRSYRKIMGMLGKWTRQMEDAYNRINDLEAQYGRDENVPSEVLDEIAELAITFQPIKPYMFTLEKYTMNNEGGVLNIPVQHKYAEAVLIPMLLPKGSMLRHMAQWMDNHVEIDPKTGEKISQPIDLMGAWSKGGDKIVKVGGYGSASLDGTNSRESLEAALNSAYVHKLNYEDYREQTNVPEHINSARLFGTQLRKLIMSNINMDKDYSDYVDGEVVNILGHITRLSGRNLVNLYNSLIVANILDSYNTLAKEIENPKQLANILQQAIINNNRQSLDNLFAFALEGEHFNIPLFEGGMEHDTAAMLMSIFKDRVNKQKIQGGAAVQVSAMGITGYKESGDLAYVGVDANGNIVRSTDPDFKDHPAVNTLYAEIEVPWDLTVNIWDKNENNGNGGYKAVDLKFSDYCNSDGTLIKDEKGQPLIEKRFPGILDRVLYRIPTEKEYSMINGKIVRFSQKTAGGTIKVPAQGTTQAGFDFDIDKLYFMMREYYVKENAFADILGQALANQLKTQEIGEALLSVIDDPLEYDLSKSCLEQHENPRIARALRNNMLITLIQKRLEDVETFKGRTQPGGFADHSFAAREMRELLYADEDEITEEKTTIGWARYAQDSYEVSSAGDSRFSALNAKFVEGTVLFGHDVSGRTIESVYQHGVKQGDWDTDNNSKTGVPKSKEIIKGNTEDASYAEGYLPLWEEWAKQNPELIAELRDKAAGKTLTDKFASSRVSQARALSDILGKGNVKSGHVNFEAIEARSKQKSLDPEPNYDPSDPYTIITYNQMNQVAGKLIGVFANQNTNHAFASLMKEFKLKKPLLFCGHTAKEGFGDLLHAPKGTNPDLNIAECLSASVDAVKDPVLNYLNFNTITANAGALLARMGYTGFEIGLLFNQPIVKEACELAYNEGITIEVAMSKLQDSYTKFVQATGVSESDNLDALSKQALADMILDGRRIKESDKEMSALFALKQLKVLDFFSEVLLAAEEVNNFITSTKFTAANSVGATFGDMYAQQMKVKKYIEGFDNPKRKIYMEVTQSINTPINLHIDNGESDEKYLENLVGFAGEGNPFAYEQAMYDMNVRFVRSMAKYFPYETRNYRMARTMAASVTKAQTLDANTINDIHSEMLSYILAQQDGDFNGDNMHIDKEHPEAPAMTHREYYLQEFPKKVAQLIEDDQSYKKDFAIFEYMLIEEDDKGNIDLKIQEVGGLSPEQKEIIKDSWAGLLDEIPDLARDLFMYCYYKAGFEFSPKSFMHLAPVALKEKIVVDKEGTTYKQILDRVLEGENSKTPIMVDITRFIKSFIMNHTDNYRFTYKTRKGKAATELDNIVRRAAIVKGTPAPHFVLSAAQLGENMQLFLPSTLEGSIDWMPAIQVDDFLYMADRQDTPKFNVSTKEDDSMTYTLVGKIDPSTHRVITTNKEAKQSTVDSGAAYQPSQIDHSEEVTEKPELPTATHEDYEKIVKTVAKEMLQRGDLEREELQGYVQRFTEALSAGTTADLQAYTQWVKQNYPNLVDNLGNIIC